MAIDEKTVEAETLAVNATTPNTDQEALQFASFTEGFVRFGVRSTGCTTAEHFHIEHELQEGQCAVTIVRDKPDFCRRAPHVIELSLAWSPPPSCNASAVQISNPIVDLNARLKTPLSAQDLPRKPQ